ncbi:MAG: glycosyltransferase family 2 protein [Clostridia bacterium]
MIIDAIVPAYNEERTIGNVISVLKQVKEINQIIVVNDHSKDATSYIAKQMGVIVVDLPNNIGKGGALKVGAEYSRGDYLLFIDADLIGLRPYHIKQILEPILSKRAETTVGIFSSGRLSTDLAQKITPFLSGQRVIKRELFQNIAALDESGYGVEIAITKHILKEKIPMEEVYLDNLTHTMKEEKLGLLKGFAARMRMYWEIAKVLWDVR